MTQSASSSAPSPASLSESPSINQRVLRIGLFADAHYADKDDAKGRCYRSSLEKMRQATSEFNRAGADFAVELGDFIDGEDSLDRDVESVRKIAEEFARFNGERHYVLGNHCVGMLTKSEFLRTCRRHGLTPYHSFDHKGYHFVVLDACYRPDEHPFGRGLFKWEEACVPAAECDWLRRDLAGAAGKTVVFLHNRLDVDNAYGLTNGPIVRDVLERSGKVSAVIQGHYHPGAYTRLGSIHYVTLAAMVTGSGAENNACAILEINRDGSMALRGFGRQKSYTLGPAR